MDMRPFPPGSGKDGSNRPTYQDSTINAPSPIKFHWRLPPSANSSTLSVTINRPVEFTGSLWKRLDQWCADQTGAFLDARAFCFRARFPVGQRLRYARDYRGFRQTRS